jgi:hypothetical protein
MAVLKRNTYVEGSNVTKNFYYSVSTVTRFTVGSLLRLLSTYMKTLVLSTKWLPQKRQANERQLARETMEITTIWTSQVTRKALFWDAAPYSGQKYATILPAVRIWNATTQVTVLHFVRIPTWWYCADTSVRSLGKQTQIRGLLFKLRTSFLLLYNSWRKQPYFQV